MERFGVDVLELLEGVLLEVFVGGGPFVPIDELTLLEKEEELTLLEEEEEEETIREVEEEVVLGKMVSRVSTLKGRCRSSTLVVYKNLSMNIGGMSVWLGIES